MPQSRTSLVRLLLTPSIVTERNIDMTTLAVLTLILCSGTLMFLRSFWPE
jgi:hypothetical protein